MEKQALVSRYNHVLLKALGTGIKYVMHALRCGRAINGNAKPGAAHLRIHLPCELRSRFLTQISVCCGDVTSCRKKLALRLISLARTRVPKTQPTVLPLESTVTNRN